MTQLVIVCVNKITYISCKVRKSSAIDHYIIIIKHAYDKCRNLSLYMQAMPVELIKNISNAA